MARKIPAFDKLLKPRGAGLPPPGPVGPPVGAPAPGGLGGAPPPTGGPLGPLAALMATPPIRKRKKAPRPPRMPGY